MSPDGRSRVLRRALTFGGLVRVRRARLVGLFSWLARPFGRLDRVGAVSRLRRYLMVFTILSLHRALHLLASGSRIAYPANQLRLAGIALLSPRRPSRASTELRRESALRLAPDMHSCDCQ
jgi:hypothetical protein